MSPDFVQETVEEERPPHIIGCLTGWEVVIFELEDDPEGGVLECGSSAPT